MIGFVIGLVITGLIIGALGRLLHPGRDSMPIWATIVIGIAASVIVGILIPGHGVLSFILAVIVAAVLVGLFGGALGRRRARF